jgi:hypothetical protein
MKIEKYQALFITDYIGGEDMDNILDENIEVSDLIEKHKIFDSQEATDAIEQFKKDNSDISSDDVDLAWQGIKDGIESAEYDERINEIITSVDKIYIDFEELDKLREPSEERKENRLPVFVDFEIDVGAIVTHILDNFDWAYLHENEDADDDTVYRLIISNPDDLANAKACLDKEGIWYDFDSGDRMMVNQDGIDCLNDNDIDFDEV